VKSAFDAARPFPISRRLFLALTTAACLVFATYAGSFLYFFVDDEAIPLVYARNLLRGRGLVYTVLEGRSEGYSDFLHVIWSTLLLFITQALHLSLLAPLLIGKTVSFVAALAIIVLTARWLRRTGVTGAGLTAALAFLALAGPLAVWACSSLETAIFALLVTGFAAALTRDARPTSVILGIALLLERIDGIVFVAALIVAALVADPRRRRAVWEVAWPIALVAIAFHTWRWSYFGSLLSAPLAAKVLYRLTGSAHAVVKAPDVPYLVGLLRLYGIAAAPLLVVAAVLAWRAPAARMAAVALLLLGTYVAVVGDWMFGWRFTVALFPLAALIIGVAVSRARPALGWCAAVLVMLWSAVAARNFLVAYVDVESRPIFWTHSRLGASAWLAPYYDLVAASRPLMHAGDRVAYNQAGLLPYLLDLENIDDLGICSRFVAHLPTTDVYYTGVGRYSPPTNEPVLRTAHAYLLYRDVGFLVTPADLLWKANHGSFPEMLLDGFFTRIAVDASRRTVIYGRTSKPADRFRHDPDAFTENLAHPSRLTRASIDGRTIDAELFGRDLPFLREQTQTLTFNGNVQIVLGLGRQDAEVSALYIGDVASSVPGELTLSLFDGAGRETLRRTIAIASPNMSVLERFDAVSAKMASVSFHSASNRVTLTDLRIAGQSPALRAYVRRALRFPAP
jgi:hypothetical protein